MSGTDHDGLLQITEVRPMPNVTLTLDEAEQMQLEEVLMDHDEQGAFEFLKRVVKHKIELHRKSSCKPAFEGPSFMPEW